MTAVPPLVSSFLWLVLVLALVTVLWWRLWVLAPASHPMGHHLAPRWRPYRLRRQSEHRAQALLRDILTPAEYAHYSDCGYLQVKSSHFPGRVYIVPEAPGPVTVCEQGRPIMRLCVQCIERVPDTDIVAMHKLMIEGNEHDYLRIANRV